MRSTYCRARLAGGGVRLHRLRVHDDLHQAAAITQIDEDEAAVVAPPVNPSRQHDVRAGIARAQVAAVVCLEHVSSWCR
jgi:hypothetical protein